MKTMSDWDLRLKEYLWDHKLVWRRVLVALVPLMFYIAVLLLIHSGR